jgi:hypothetical protein
MVKSGFETAKKQGNGVTKYAVAIIAIAVVVLAAVYFSGSAGTSTTTTTIATTLTTISTTSIPSTTVQPVTTVSTEVFAPVIQNFTRNDVIIVINKTSAARQGAAYGYAFSYFENQNKGRTLSVRTLTFANINSMVSQYDLIASNQNIIMFSHLPTNVTGGKINMQSSSGMSAYTMTSHSGNTLITTSLTLTANALIGDDASESVLLVALDSTIADIANLT